MQTPRAPCECKGVADSALFAPSLLLPKGGYRMLLVHLRRGISHMCGVFAKDGASDAKVSGEISVLSKWIS